MKITFNGKLQNVTFEITAAELLIENGYKSRTSIWVNGKQLLKSEYETFVIPEGALVKALRVIGGG